MAEVSEGEGQVAAGNKILRVIKSIFKGFLRYPILKVKNLEQIKKVISEIEKTTSAEIKVIIEKSLEVKDIIENLSSNARAINHFSRYHLWDTENRTAILIYILLADQEIQIVVDRTIKEVIGLDFFDSICSEISKDFKQEKFVEGLSHAIIKIAAKVSEKFPAGSINRNEIDDKPIII